MIPGDKKVSKDDGTPVPAKVELTPEPIECSEKNCHEPVFLAYWPKGTKQFKFACMVHQQAVGNQPTLTYDDIETYRKLRKRKMYHKHFQEYLK